MYEARGKKTLQNMIFLVQDHFISSVNGEIDISGIVDRRIR